MRISGASCNSLLWIVGGELLISGRDSGGNAVETEERMSEREREKRVCSGGKSERDKSEAAGPSLTSSESSESSNHL